MYREDCLTGRLFASEPQDQDSCIDGQRVVFHTVKGANGADPQDNCEAFHYGEGYAEVFYCKLNSSLQCEKTRPAVTSSRATYAQSQPFFHQKGGETYLIVNQGPQTILSKLGEPQSSSVLFAGMGGYPLVK